MIRTSALLCCAGAFAAGCRAGAFIIPRPTLDQAGNWVGTGYYTTEEPRWFEVSPNRRRLIPPSLLDDRRLYTAARNCAEAHNGTLYGLQLCTIATSILRPAALTAGLWASLSSGISASMGPGEDMAKRRWEWSALSSSLIGATLGAIELFTNCTDRREVQAMVVMRQARAIENAAQKANCAVEAAKREDKAGKLLEKALTDVDRELRVRVESVVGTDEEKLNWLRDELLATATKSVAAAKQKAEYLIAHAGDAAAKTAADESERTSKLDAQRASDVAEALRELDVPMCTNSSGGKGSASSSHFMDEARQVLEDCLQAEYVNFGTPSGARR